MTKERKKIDKITLTEPCIVRGNGFPRGKVLSVPKEISEHDARYLICINKAKVADEAPASKKASAKD